MTEPYDSIFAALVEGKPPVTSRMQVLTNATAAQLASVPNGSDVAFTMPGVFQYGVYDDEARAEYVRCAEANECGHLHGFFIYTPPVPTEDSALTAESIASNAVDLFDGALRKARSDDPDPDLSERDVLTMMVESAVHTAREGMVFPPF